MLHIFVTHLDNILVIISVKQPDFLLTETQIGRLKFSTAKLVAVYKYGASG